MKNERRKAVKPIKRGTMFLRVRVHGIPCTHAPCPFDFWSCGLLCSFSWVKQGCLILIKRPRFDLTQHTPCTFKSHFLSFLSSHPRSLLCTPPTASHFYFVHAFSFLFAPLFYFPLHFIFFLVWIHRSAFYSLMHFYFL